ncbi:uncharacterized protein K02A2.6-like, partial [Anneissia japonica]|uniref:uncharacterized protein K02A2.6-like n=1 Tax=Anneissia japonica TaxID=1529436 RepID=UPI001425A5C8
MNAPTIVITDASPVGLGAILLQEQTEGELRPVAYASHSLTETERRYSQVEREALGCVWGIEHFHVYLWGQKFKVKVDHKPLIYMFGPKANSQLPARIQRLSWRLLGYDFDIEHIPGKQNIADSLSRLPLTCSDSNTIAEDYIRQVVHMYTSEPDALTIDDFKIETNKDHILSNVNNIMETGKWPRLVTHELKPYYVNQCELFVYDSLLIRGNRIVVPLKLRQSVLSLAHETHQGMVRTKQVLRDKYYWPKVDANVESNIRNCSACEINQALPKDQPLQTSELPCRPWSKLGMDLVGPIQGEYILTITDYYSSYPEAIIVKEITSNVIIECLQLVFARFGYPDEVLTDNGKQFISAKIEKYFNACGIKHLLASPYYPKTNGEIERFHRYLKKCIKNAKTK